MDRAWEHADISHFVEQLGLSAPNLAPSVQQQQHATAINAMMQLAYTHPTHQISPQNLADLGFRIVTLLRPLLAIPHPTPRQLYAFSQFTPWLLQVASAIPEVESMRILSPPSINPYKNCRLTDFISLAVIVLMSPLELPIDLGYPHGLIPGPVGPFHPMMIPLATLEPEDLKTLQNAVLGGLGRLAADPKSPIYVPRKRETDVNTPIQLCPSDLGSLLRHWRIQIRRMRMIHDSAIAPPTHQKRASMSIIKTLMDSQNLDPASFNWFMNAICTLSLVPGGLAHIMSINPAGLADCKYAEGRLSQFPLYDHTSRLWQMRPAGIMDAWMKKDPSFPAWMLARAVVFAILAAFPLLREFYSSMDLRYWGTRQVMALGSICGRTYLRIGKEVYAAPDDPELFMGMVLGYYIRYRPDCGLSQRLKAIGAIPNQ